MLHIYVTPQVRLTARIALGILSCIIFVFIFRLHRRLPFTPPPCPTPCTGTEGGAWGCHMSQKACLGKGGGVLQCGCSWSSLCAGGWTRASRSSIKRDWPPRSSGMSSIGCSPVVSDIVIPVLIKQPIDIHLSTQISSQRSVVLLGMLCSFLMLLMHSSFLFDWCDFPLKFFIHSLTSPANHYEMTAMCSFFNTGLKSSIKGGSRGEAY